MWIQRPGRSRRLGLLVLLMSMVGLRLAMDPWASLKGAWVWVVPVGCSIVLGTLAAVMTDSSGRRTPRTRHV